MSSTYPPPSPLFSVHIQKVTDSSESAHVYMFLKYKHHFRRFTQCITYEFIRQLIANHKEYDIPYCPKEQLPPTPPEIEEVQKCFLKLLKKESPMLEGEYVMGDQFTFLLDALEGIPAGTALLLRKTNKAEMVFVIHTTQVVLEHPTMTSLPLSAPPQLELAAHAGSKVPSVNLKHVSAKQWVRSKKMKSTERHSPEAVMKKMVLKAAPPSAAHNQAVFDKSKSVSAQIAKNILDYALKEIIGDVGKAFLGPIGALCVDAIFDAFFPSGKKPDMFQKISEIVDKVVGQKLQENDIDTINGAMSNVVHSLQHEYYPRRKMVDLSKVEHRQDLMQLLQKYDTTFLAGPSGMLALLQQDKYQKAGLAAYISGISLQIAIYQEMATVDPLKVGGKFLSPLESSYGKPQVGTVAKVAKDAATYISGIWPKMKEDRQNQLKLTSWQTCHSEGRPGGAGMSAHTGVTTVCTNHIGVSDPIANETYGDETIDYDLKDDKFEDLPDSLKELLTSEKERVVKEFTEQMCEPETMVAQLHKLIDKPLNIK